MEQILNRLDARDAAAVAAMEASDFGEYGPSIVVSEEMGRMYRHLSGDDNPIHFDANAAEKGPFGVCVVYGKLPVILLPKLQPPTPIIFDHVGDPVQRTSSQLYKKALSWDRTIHARMRILKIRRLGRAKLLMVKCAYEIADFEKGEVIIYGVEMLAYPIT